MAQLWVVATPIGNLGDMSPRMERALRECDLIAAEDTRVTAKLLAKLEIKKPMLSCHRHNEDRRGAELVGRMLEEDLTVALTCDAGTPGISDPGSDFVRLAREAGIPVTPIPGPCAAAAAISASGFDAREFTFYGFLPREKKALREKLLSVRRSNVPVAVFYESPHRVAELVAEIASTLAGARVAVCCDLTKLYEKILVANAEEALAALRANPNAEKGEYCVVVDLSPLPPVEAEAAPLSAAARMLESMLDGADAADAAEAALAAGCPRNEVYRARLRIRKLLDAEN